MTRIVWDDRRFEAGVDRGVLYPGSGPGVPWNGITKIEEKPEDNSEMIIFVDGKRIVVELSAGSYAAELSAVTYPTQFERYDGYSDHFSSQNRDFFNLSYRTLIGNDLEGLSLGYKIHLVYNILATPSDHPHSSLNAESSMDIFTWSLSTVPVHVPYFKPSAHFVIDTTKAYPAAVSDLEDFLYGSDLTNPTFPTFDQLFDIFEEHAILKIIDHGDGTWTAIGPDEAIQMLDATTFEITWPSAIFLDADSYKISSL